MRRFAVLNAFFVLALMVAICVPSAHASAALQLFDGATCATSNCITITDAGVITTVGTASAAITFAPGKVVADASVGSVFTLSINVGQSKPLLTNGTSMDLTTTDIVSVGAGTLHIWWSDINFNTPPGYAQMAGGGTNNKGGTITYNVYADAGNHLFAPTTLLGTLGPFSGTGSSYGGDLAGSVSVPQPPPYALMEELVYTVTGATSMSGDFSLDIVPEPASVALFGGVLLFTVSALRRRGKR